MRGEEALHAAETGNEAEAVLGVFVSGTLTPQVSAWIMAWTAQPGCGGRHENIRRIFVIITLLDYSIRRFNSQVRHYRLE